MGSAGGSLAQFNRCWQVQVNGVPTGGEELFGGIECLSLYLFTLDEHQEPSASEEEKEVS